MPSRRAKAPAPAPAIPIAIANDAIPIANDAIPIANDAIPIANDVIPIANDVIPIANDVIPIANDVIAVKPIAKKRSRKAPVVQVAPVVEEEVASVVPVVPVAQVAPVVEEEVVAPVAPVAPVASLEAPADKPITKKRGRKPKGGKLIQNLTNDNVVVSMVPNIILHLKCGAADIDSSIIHNYKEGDVVSFNVMDNKGADLHDLYHSDNELKPNNALMGNNAYNYLNDTASDDDCDEGGNTTTKTIMKKLNHLKISFHMSDLFQTVGAAPRRSCCFWDTCEFDTPPVYLPKCISNNGGYVVYACFCSPECALAYLMDERIDTSVKFERCQMLNAMHGKVNVSIKPAPNPHYTLGKFYGNLSIQEYRMLFKSEQIVYVVSKPLTHILPEIYEENNDFMLNNKIIPTNNYKPKKKFGVF